MFGYIKPLKPEMKIKEYDKFRAYYCGVCESISKRTGQAARFLLSYDSAFFAVFLDAVYNDGNTNFKAARCLVHPVKKRLHGYDSKCIDYASDINVLLAWYNVLDKYIDGEKLKTIPVMVALKRAYNKCKGRYGQTCKYIENELERLHQLEDKKCDIIDKTAEPFANIIKKIIIPPFLDVSENTKTAIEWIGYNIGKWLYLTDAFDDIKEDVQNNNYNPFLYSYNFSNDKPVEDFKSDIKENVEFILVNSLDQISKGYELIDIYRNHGIIENIIYMGMLNITDKVLRGDMKNEKSV